MKTVIYLLFLLPAGASVYSQSAQPAYPPLAPVPHLFRLPSPGNPLLPGNQVNPLLSTPQLDITGSPNLQIDVLMSPNPIRILQPDNMPCLVPNLSRLERMPVKRTRNADRMPNAAPGVK
jgi:hypothetical protein